MDKEYLKSIAGKELPVGTTSMSTTDKVNADITLPQYGDIRNTIENYLSILSAKKLWAKEPIIQMSNKQTEQKTFDKIWKEQNILDKIMFVAEQEASKNGKVYVVIQKDTAGRPPIVRLATSGIHTEVGNQLVDVTVFTRITAGSRLYTIAQRFFGGKINTKITTEEEGDNGKVEQVDIDVNTFNETSGQNIVETESYTGSMPVVLLENINSFDGNGHSDLWNQEENLRLVQKLWDRIFWELDTNMTRIFTDKSVGSGTTGQARATYNALVGKGIVVENPGITVGGEGRWNITTSNLDINTHMNAFFKALDFLMETAGFKRNSDDKGSVQQNDLEIQQVRDSEITSFKMKERTRQTFLTSIIKKIFEALGTPVKNDPSIEIQYMSVKNETAIIDNMEKQINNALITRVDAIAKINNISQDEAKDKYKEIKAEQEAVQEAMVENQVEETPKEEGGNTDEVS